MACSTFSCQSGCYKDLREEELSHSSTSSPVCKTSCKTGAHDRHQKICTKCKEKDVLEVINSQVGTHCFDCFRSNIFAKFRAAVSCNALINPSDNVLVAFSAGSSSRMALQFVHELQYRSQKNFDASRDKAPLVFGVGVAFVDETSIFSHDSSNAIKEMELIVSRLCPPEKKFHHVPVEIAYADSADGYGGMKELLSTVSDATGKDDLLQHFRMLALQKVALDNGYTKVLLGSSASRIACHVISMTVKGKGYSLPADIQYIDTRWEVPVLLPLRDCLARELKLICDIENLETLDKLEVPRSGINELVSSFVSLLQEENPSRESTIVRTASKLTPFNFNKIQIPKDGDEMLCLICHSPVCNPGALNGDTLNGEQSIYHTFKAACCSSCRLQIIPADSSTFEQFYSNLPTFVIDRFKVCSRKSVRENIKDFLLPDSEDESYNDLCKDSHKS